MKSTIIQLIGIIISCLLSYYGYFPLSFQICFCLFFSLWVCEAFYYNKSKKVRLFIALIVLTTILPAYFGFIIIDLKYLATYFTGAIIVTLIWVFFDKMIHNNAS